MKASSRISSSTGQRRCRLAHIVCTPPLVVVAGASPTRHGLYDLDLFAGTGVLDKVPDVDDAIVAGVGALEAGVVRLYSVVVLLGRWVRVGCARLCGVHKSSLWAGLRGVAAPAEPLLYPTSSLYTHMYHKSTID